MTEIVYIFVCTVFEIGVPFTRRAHPESDRPHFRGSGPTYSRGYRTRNVPDLRVPDLNDEIEIINQPED